MMNWYGSGMNGWAYAYMIISNLLFWALIIGGGVALFRYLTQARPAQSPEQILAERFARGEIGEDDYRLRLAALRVTGPVEVRRRSAGSA